MDQREQSLGSKDFGRVRVGIADLDAFTTLIADCGDDVTVDVNSDISWSRCLVTMCELGQSVFKGEEPPVTGHTLQPVFTPVCQLEA